MGPSDWVELLKFKLIRVQLLILAREVDMTLSGALFVANGYESNEFIL